MGFVNEEVDTPEKRVLFESFKLRSPLSGDPIRPDAWTVDRERSFYLIALGGGSFETPHFLAFVLPEGVVQLEGQRDATGNRSRRDIVVTWKIEGMRLPRVLKDRSQEIISAIKEALTAHGNYYDNTGVVRVAIDLPTPVLV